MEYLHLKLSSGAGTSVRKLQLGKSYGRSDRPGVYNLIRFESGEEAQVREYGTGVVMVVPLSVLTPIKKVPEKEREDVENVPVEKWNEAKKKHKAIEKLIPLSRIPQTKWDEAAKEHGVSKKALRNWLDLWRANPKLSSLFRSPRKDMGSARLHPFVEKKLAEYLEILRKNADMQVSDIVENLDHDIKAERKRTKNKRIVMPADSTIYQRWNSFSEIDKAQGRVGTKKAYQRHGLHRGTLLDVDHPLACIQVDHLELPVMVVDEKYRVSIGRGWITVLIDIWSRMIYGYYITLEAPSNLSLGLAVVHGILPKTETLNRLPFKTTWPICGFPWQVHADNAGEFHGNMLELAANEYDFEIVFRKVKEPQYGGYIESYLGTLSNSLRHLPGSTREGKDALDGTDPSESAVMTLAELDEYILCLITKYHHDSHSGLNGMTPVAKFLEGMRGTDTHYPVGDLTMPDDPVKLMLDFIPADERVINPQGVQIDYIHYMDDVLQRWVNARDPVDIKNARQFIFRIDPRDITRIFFWDPDDKRYYIIPTRNVTRPAMSSWEYKAVRQLLKEKGIETVNEDIIFDAMEERRRIVAKATTMTKTAAKAREAQRALDAVRGAQAFMDKVAASGSAKAAEKAAPKVVTGEPDKTTKTVDTDEVPAAPYEMDW